VFEPAGVALWEAVAQLFHLQLEPPRLKVRAFEREQHFEPEQHFAPRFGTAIHPRQVCGGRGFVGQRSQRRVAPREHVLVPGGRQRR
jgi:hypothetical protein